MNVEKRDGRIVPFDSSKIKNAVLAAFRSVDGNITEYAITKANNIADYIEGYYEDVNEIPNIESIQDLVEKGLMALKRKDVAKEYILYREQRNKERQKKSNLMKTIKEKIEALNVQNSNANMDEKSFGGRAGEARDELLKDYALNYIMSKKSRENHLNNEIYIHDLSSYALGSHNCLTIPFDELLAKGFNTRQTDIRPAKSINTAFQLLAVIFQIQSLQQFGGVSASHLDWTMVPYVRMSFFKHWKDGLKYIEKYSFKETTPRTTIPKTAILDISHGFILPPTKAILVKDKKSDNEYYYDDSLSILSFEKENYPNAYQYAIDMTEKELIQAVEGMFHNLNSLQSRSGNQLPFSSINFGTCTLIEGRMVIKAILEGSIKGVGKVHKTSVFPCTIFQYMKGINDKPGTPNYDLYQLALQSTAKRLYPNYANIDWSGNAGYDINDPKTYFSTMRM